jgi:hypothetical protein
MSPALQRKREIPRSKERFEKGETNNEGSNAIPIRKHWSTAIICSKAPSFGAEEPDPRGICREHTPAVVVAGGRRCIQMRTRHIIPADACVCVWVAHGDRGCGCGRVVMLSALLDRAARNRFGKAAGDIAEDVRASSIC